MGLVLALCGSLPAVVLMFFVARMDARRPEPRRQLWLVTALGGLSTLPVIVLELVLSRFEPPGTLGALYKAFVVAAVIEESAKAVALYVGVWKHPAFDERLDGIVYGTRAGLGFALVENIGYLFGAESVSGFLGIFIMRAILAVPGHAIWGGFMGYWAARRRFDGTGPGLWGGLVIAVGLHGAYDAALFLCGVWAERAPLLVLPLLVVPFWVIIGGYRRLRAHASDALRLDDLTHAPRELRLPFGLGFVLR